jgi:hypothetical protein
MHLLILACSATKRPNAGLLPAIERYNGPTWRTLRAALRQPRDTPLSILVLSAEFGLITADTEIANYDRRMTPARASELRPQVAGSVREHLAGRSFEATFINLGRDYLPALDIEPALAARLGTVTEACGGIGMRMSQLKHWLA